MLTIAMRMLFVGEPTAQISAILTRLGQRGFGSCAIESARCGRELMQHCKFDLVIALEEQADGRGYDFIEPVIGYGGSLFVGIATPSSQLWLPVVDHGEKVLGTKAVDYDTLERELEDVLLHRSPCARPTRPWVPLVAPGIPEKGWQSRSPDSEDERIAGSKIETVRGNVPRLDRRAPYVAAAEGNQAIRKTALRRARAAGGK